MTGQNRAPDGIDTATPNVARIYDYLLGGKDNFAIDRTAAKQLIAAIPDAAEIARDNRSFLGRVVRYLAARGGIRQFLDLGSGLPTQANVHELAQGVAPEARVVYVDNDPMVVSHARALLASGGQVGVAFGDLRDPASVLHHPVVLDLLDLTRPMAVLCTSTLHFIGDEAEPHKIIAEYRDLTPGSYLAVSHGTLEEDAAGEVDKAVGVYRQASSQLHIRRLPEVLRFFDGLELVEPGLTWITEWRPEPGTAPTGRRHSMRGGVGRKPRAS
jgi:hypothetical protein